MTDNKGIFFIADTHFNDKNIIHYTRRPFKSLVDMDEQLIINWNGVVDNSDTVFVLGDFFSGSSKSDFRYMCYLMKHLNGNKILIMGNHDEFAYHKYLSAGFMEVYRYPIIYRDYMMLSHYPLYISGDTPYVNIFGHVHANPIYTDLTTHSMCVSVERSLMDYRPISYEDVVSLMKSERVKIGMD